MIRLSSLYLRIFASTSLTNSSGDGVYSGLSAKLLVSML